MVGKLGDNGCEKPGTMASTWRGPIMLVCFPLFTDGVVRLNYSRNQTPLLGAGSNKGYTHLLPKGNLMCGSFQCSGGTSVLEGP